MRNELIRRAIFIRVESHHLSVAGLARVRACLNPGGPSYEQLSNNSFGVTAWMRGVTAWMQ